LGSDQFVTKVLAKLPKKSQKELSEIPKKQRRKVYALSTYFRGKEKAAAIYDAYYSGGYSQREIGEYLGHHYSWVSRLLKIYERQGKT
jgi:DNA-directed RNA polymerase specialized sigma subunit